MSAPRTWIDLRETEVAAELDGSRQWILYMPAGKFPGHKSAGTITNDRKTLEQFEANFRANVRGVKPPIDAEHETSQEGAAGWIEDVQVRDDGLWAMVEWTDRGQKLIASRRFRYFSPEWYREWKAPDGKTYRNVIVGGALTNSPFFREPMGANPLLAASEGLYVEGAWDVGRGASKDNGNDGDQEDRNMSEDRKRDDELVDEGTDNGEGADAGKDAGAPGDGKMTAAERDAYEARIKALEEQGKSTATELAAERDKRVRGELVATLKDLSFELAGDKRALTPAARELVADIAMELDGTELIAASEEGKANDLTARDRFIGMVRNLGAMTYPVGEKGFAAQIGDEDAGEDVPVDRVMKAVEEKRKAAVAQGETMSEGDAISAVMAEHPEWQKAYGK